VASAALIFALVAAGRGTPRSRAARAAALGDALSAAPIAARWGPDFGTPLCAAASLARVSGLRSAAAIFARCSVDSGRPLRATLSLARWSSESGRPARGSGGAGKEPRNGRIKKGLSPEADEAFRRAGVFHILAVSGFNVALLASSIFFVLSALGVPRRTTAVAAGAALAGFALVVGGQASVLRATVMGLLLLAATLLDRESQLLNALALAALLLLAWRPGDLWDPGFQLSFAATAGIVYLTPAITAWLADRGWPASLATAVAVSMGAQAAVTPVMLMPATVSDRVVVPGRTP
jgi:ComEC/Rec2-related protein